MPELNFTINVVDSDDDIERLERAADAVERLTDAVEKFNEALAALTTTDPVMEIGLVPLEVSADLDKVVDGERWELGIDLARRTGDEEQ